jgi:hypothetical protein
VAEKIRSPQRFGPVASKGAQTLSYFYCSLVGTLGVVDLRSVAAKTTGENHYRALSRIISGKHSEGSQTQTAWFCQHYLCERVRGTQQVAGRASRVD